MQKINLTDFVDEINKRLGDISITTYIPGSSNHEIEWRVKFMDVEIPMPIKTLEYKEDRPELDELETIGVKFLERIQKINRDAYKRTEKFIQELFRELTSKPSVVVETENGYKFSHLIIADKSISVDKIDAITSRINDIARMELSKQFLWEKAEMVARKLIDKYRSRIKEIVNNHNCTITRLDYGINHNFWIAVFITNSRGEDGEFKFGFPVVKTPGLFTYLDSRNMPGELARELHGTIQKLAQEFEEQILQIRTKMLEAGIEVFIKTPGRLKDRLGDEFRA